MPGFIIRRIQPSFRQLPNDFFWESSPRIIGGYWRGHLWEGSPLGLGSLNVGCCPWYDWVISPTVYPFPSPQYRLHPAETQRNSLKIGYLHFRWMILTLPIIKLPFKKGMHCIIMKLVISHDIPLKSPGKSYWNILNHMKPQKNTSPWLVSPQPFNTLGPLGTLGRFCSPLGDRGGRPGSGSKRWCLGDDNWGELEHVFLTWNPMRCKWL